MPSLVNEAQLGRPDAQSVLDTIDPDDNFFNEVYSGLRDSSLSEYYSVERFNSSFMNINHDSLLILAANIRSNKNNMEYFHTLLKSLVISPDIIVLSETWIVDSDL